MLRGQNALVQSLLGSLFTWGLTALGAAAVFPFTSNNKKLLDVSLGFAAGVMTAASFWSLLAPALEITAEQHGRLAFLPVAVGFVAGALFVYLADRLVPMDAYHKPTEHSSATAKRSDNPTTGFEQDGLRQRKKKNEISEHPSTEEEPDLRLSWHRILLLVIAITVHNIPEGLAVGVGFGAIGRSPSATFESAFNLAVGIGLQNFPEGLAVSLPLSGFGYSKTRAFFYGQLSGMVEPVAALLGALAVTWMQALLSYALAFAAGAMIFVVVDDIVPEAQIHGNGKLASWGCVLGFVVMMALDVGLA